MQALLSFLNIFIGIAFKDKELEEKYQKIYLAEHIEQNVLTAKLAIFMYLFYAPLTYAFIQNEALLLLNIVLFSISGPLILIHFSQTDFFQKYSYTLLFIAALIAGMGPTLYYIFTANDRALFQVDIVIPIIAIFTMYGIGLSLSLLIYVSITLLFILLSFIVGLPFVAIYMALYVSIFGAVISTLSAYMIERSNRKLFLANIKSEEFKFIIENSHDAISIFDSKETKYLYANQTALQRNNDILENIIGKNILEVHKNLTKQEIDYIKMCIENKGIYNDVVSLKDKDGKNYYVHNMSQYGYFNSKKAIISVSSDVTELKKAELQMRDMALKDPLTQLFNRYKLDEYSMLEIDRYKRERQSVSLIICDIDFFKQVNDTYGHLVGDSVLKKIANVLKNCVRETDVVARWGGEEFAILLSNTEKEESIRIAEKINKKIASIKYADAGYITISCGVSKLQVSDTQKTWFHRVDNALYEAKENGRNRVVYK